VQRRAGQILWLKMFPTGLVQSTLVRVLWLAAGIKGLSFAD
jgi:hypothetical protein